MSLHQIINAKVYAPMVILVYQAIAKNAYRLAYNAEMSNIVFYVKNNMDMHTKVFLYLFEGACIS